MAKAKPKKAVNSAQKGGRKARSISKTRTLKLLGAEVVGSTSATAEIHGFRRGLGVLSHLEESPAKLLPPIGSSVDGECHIFGQAAGDYQKKESEILKDSLDHWQKSLVENRSLDSIFLQSRRAPLWILRPRKIQGPTQSGRGKTKSHHYGLLETSPYAQMRDRVGGLWHSLKDTHGVKHLGLFFHDCTDEEISGALAGLEIASYRFNHVVKSKQLHPHFKITAFGAEKQQILGAKRIGESVNLARHLVNLDAAKINPATYSEFVMKWFQGVPTVSVDIWGPERLLKEKMHLHYGVGQAATHRSHMVHIKYRPKGQTRLSKPLAFLGKGVTFDTGGLDIKPASGMRFMKKDMGGSASIVGIAHWLSESGSDVACDLYLALAENAVDAHSFRPGDVLTARNGLTVEIHNTDAEGRLVMADVMDVATNKPIDSAPVALIDLSTLTGAMRVAVGTEIAGMFANHDGLADLALSSGQKAGDPAWRIPLWDNYKTQLKSSFADLANASDSGFGGAITAALFLQKFLKHQIPWLHFDLYCWSDRANGAIGDSGGNGQGVQMMVSLLERISQGTFGK
jgi:leucyl aminopeptidase